jgi:nucleotide-binding universal stress UspA family protein
VAFTSSDVGADLVRMASSEDVDLIIIDGQRALRGAGVPRGDVGTVLAKAPSDVAVLVARGTEIVLPGQSAPVIVPFGGTEHDWAALELGAWLAFTTNAPLRLVGTKADPHRGQRDASRLLADASLAVQRVVGVEAAPLLAEATEHALLEVVSSATLVVAGVSQRWRQDGIGSVRRALVRAAGTPTLLVHKGPRPGGLAPSGSRTSFTWSIQG